MKNEIVKIAFLFVVLTFSSCNTKQEHKESNDHAPEGKVAYSDSASSSVKVFDENGRVCIQQSNTYYQLTDVYEGNVKTPLLLKIRKTELCFADSVNKHKVYEVEANSILDSKEVKWNAQFVATDVEFKDNSLLAIHEGVDGEEDFLQRFSLQSGKQIFSCSYGELKVAVPNVKQKRFIGYTSQKAATLPVQELKTENLLGLIKYGNGSAEAQQLMLKLKRSAIASKIPLYTPEMILVAANSNTSVIEDGKQIILMKADENYTAKDVTGFALKLTFYYGDDNEAAEVVIPISNDQFDLAKAVFDKDIFELSAK